MTETVTGSDMGIGLGLAFGVLALLAAIAMTVTAYLAAMNPEGPMQLYSAISFAVALVVAGLSIVAIHVFEW